jgi:uncharacterized membrane protein YdjX (TVP38/TMEM64 family)
VTDETSPPLRSARAIILAALVAGLAILASSDAVHGVLLRVFEMSRDIITRHTVAGPLVFVVLAMLSAMLAFFSSAVLVAPAVFAWGPVNTALLLLVGWMLGGILSYALARHVGRPALRWLARGRSKHREEARLTPETPLGLVILFQLALPSEIPGFVLGLVRYPFARYVVALAIGELPYAVGTVLLGVTFVERRVGAFIALGAVAVLAILFLAPALRHRLRPDRGP